MRSALGEQQLCFDDVGHGNGLSDRMLDLQPRIDFQKVVLFCCWVDEELKSTK